MTLIVFYADHHEVPMPPGHRFPMAKYRALRQRLLETRVLRADELHASGQASRADLSHAHSQAWIDTFLSGRLTPSQSRDIGLPWSPQLVARTLASVFGTLAAARAALSFGVAGNLAGGTHHAFADRGEGFCVFNDLAVTAAALLDDGAVERVAILDLDVHHGNGTAAIFNDTPQVFTCSIHGERNYPFEKPPGDLDIALPDRADDDTYLEALERALDATVRFRPDLVLYQAGVDVLKEDRLGRLSLSVEGLRARDQRVLQTTHRLHIPTVLTLGGGYARPIDPSLEGHINTYRVAKSLWS